MKKKIKKVKAIPGEFVGEIIHPISITPARQKEAKKQLAAARKKTQAEMTDQDRLELNLFSLRFRMEDYLAGNP